MKDFIQTYLKYTVLIGTLSLSHYTMANSQILENQNVTVKTLQPNEDIISVHHTAPLTTKISLVKNRELAPTLEEKTNHNNLNNDIDTQTFIKNKIIDLLEKSLKNTQEQSSKDADSKDLDEKLNNDDFGECHPQAYQVGIKHFKYAETKKEDLVWSGYGVKNHRKYLIHKQAKPALDEMIKAAKKDGITLKPNSIFRSVNRQKQIIEHKLKTQKPYDVYHISSPAGYSEHHTGLAMDFNSIDNTFDHSSAYRWLLKNAEKFGFEQTFTQEYSTWSGVSEESWHWRYIGKNGEFAYIFQASINRQC